jgi:anaerobic ribonucleoside-triphosphate reductase
MKNQRVVCGGKLLKETYADFQKEMDMVNKAFLEVMMEGDMDSRIFTFPIPTYNITRDFNWDSENAKLLFEMTAKFGTPYFQNFVNSTLKPGDVRSMCCRLQLDVRELRRKTGGLFGSGEQTGSIGVVTMNLPRLGYLSKTRKELFEKLERLMTLAKNALEIKRKEVGKNMQKGLLPYTKRYLGTFDNHFSTIGLVGTNECCMNFLGKQKGISTPEGKAFAIEILDFMRKKLVEFQNETGHIFNLEATPAEGTSFRLAKHDKKLYPEIITAGNDIPYYTNSSQLPVSYTNDVFEALKHQDELQCKYTGGTVLHCFIGERISDWKVARDLIKKVAYAFRLPYFTITPTFSVCPVHGYISGEHHECPYEHTPEQLAKYGREIEVKSEVLQSKEVKA